MWEEHELIELAKEIWWSGVRAVDPFKLVARNIELDDDILVVCDHAVRLRRKSRVLVVGAGKASASMARAVEHRLRPLVRDGRLQGWVNVPEDQVEELEAIVLHGARPPGVNTPTEAGVRGAGEIEKLVSSASKADVVLCLLSGGGSALLPAPVEGVTLRDKQEVTALLHACGATIDEMNAVRKHLSRFKGGGLVQLSQAGHIFSLIISDVVGDPVDVIASGPTAADPSTFADACAVLERYGLWDRVPESVRRYLSAGLEQKVPETLKRLPSRVVNVVLGNNRMALNAAARAARRAGFRVLDLGAYWQGETRDVAQVAAAIVRSIIVDGKPAEGPICLLSGGETTVTLPAEHGLGGRNQEFALAFAAALDPETLADVVCLAAGTDGEDGPTDAAGGIVSLSIWGRGVEQVGEPDDALRRHDAYHWLKGAGGLFRTGPTGTNVMDLRVVLVA